MHRWLEEPSGQLLLDFEMRQLDECLANLFGYHLVQIGRMGTTDLLAESRILHQLVVEVEGDPALEPGPEAVGYHRTVARARASDLPIESDSVDVLVLPHLLEFEEDAQQVLRESTRVVVPEGHLIVTGFNPISSFGLWRLFRRRSAHGPWAGDFRRLDRIKDWLSLLGFDLMQIQGCFHRPPVNRVPLLRAMGRMRPDFLGRQALFAGAYVIVARKRVTRLTPIRTPWRPRRRLAQVGLASPAARNGVTRRAGSET